VGVLDLGYQIRRVRAQGYKFRAKGLEEHGGDVNALTLNPKPKP